MFTELEKRIKTNRNGEDVEVIEYLVMEAVHYGRNYEIHVAKETVHGEWSTYIPFASGNFTVRIGTGRKSAKKLEKLENYLKRNKEALKNMWINNKYQLMADTIQQDVIIEKLV